MALNGEDRGGGWMDGSGNGMRRNRAVEDVGTKLVELVEVEYGESSGG